MKGCVKSDKYKLDVMRHSGISMQPNIYIINSPSFPTKKDFEYSAVWCEWYDSDEMPYLKSLCDSENEFQNHIIKAYEEGKETYYPLLGNETLPYREFLYVSVVISIPGIKALSGYVSTICDEIVAISVWLKEADDTLVFYNSDRLVADDENPKSIKLISQLFGVKQFTEINYESECRLSNGNTVRGRLQLSST